MPLNSSELAQAAYELQERYTKAGGTLSLPRDKYDVFITLQIIEKESGKTIEYTGYVEDLKLDSIHALDTPGPWAKDLPVNQRWIPADAKPEHSFNISGIFDKAHSYLIRDANKDRFSNLIEE